MDNLTNLVTNINDKITNAGGPNSILAADHNAILNEFVQKSGKYVGAPFKARSVPNLGVVPAGSMFWNNNALDTTTDFVVTFSKMTADLNDVGLYLSRLNPGSLIQFKDFSGRSAYFIFKSYVADTDSNTDDIYQVTMSGLAENTNYNYQAGDDEICVFDFIIGSSNYIPFGTLTIRQSEANNTAGTSSLTAGDFGHGALNNDIFLNFGIYVAGDPMDVGSWDPDTVDYYDANDIN